MGRPIEDHLCWEWNPARPGDRTETVAEISDGVRPGPDRSPGPDGPHPGACRGGEVAGSPSIDFTLHPRRESAEPDLDVTVAGLAPTSALVIGASADSRDATPGGTPLPAFPEAGDGIAGFRLVSELGRGAFGRVFLAEESLLANRLVALKVTRTEGDEPRLLARLQHTHIVPIHSVHDDPKTGLRVMCMPYFGGANLAQVLDAVATSRASASGNRSLLHALDVVGLPSPSVALGPIAPPRRPPHPATGGASTPPSPPFKLEWPGADGRAATDGDSGGAPRGGSGPCAPPTPLRSLLGRVSSWSGGSFEAARRAWSRPEGTPGPPGEADPVQPARRFLREASDARAAAWIIARLAEGLEHAHQHGLLHRDLKPSNILIAADGTPMLLDFNLAADATIEARRGDRVRLGGTLPYMAPEHLDAFRPHGTTPPDRVDERSDVYALGLMLFEIVAGHRPFAEPEPNRPILETIQAMIEERRSGAPTLRSVLPGVPADLDAVVRKCLHPDPDRRHARAAHLAEDLRRFLDDEPLRYAAEPTWRGRASKWIRRNPRATGASTMGLLGLAMLVVVNAAGITLAQHLRVASARLRLKGFEARFPEYQFLLNTVGGPVESLARGIALAEETLDQAGIEPGVAEGSGGWLEDLPPAEQREPRRDLAEVILLLARARVFLADRSAPTGRREALAAAIAWLDRAERVDPRPSLALFDDRATYRARLGDEAGADRDRRAARALPPSTGRDYYLQGTALLAGGDTDAAEGALTRATILSPRGFWPYFALGLCHFDQKRYAEAAGDFTVCSVLAPEFAWPWANRGLALAQAHRPAEARSALDRAIEVDEGLADAWAARGLLALEQDDPASARADLERAVALGRGDLAIRAALGEALGRSGQAAEALTLLDDLIDRHPDAALPRAARGALRVRLKVPGGEDDFRAILGRDPRQADAYLGLARARREAEPAEALRLALVARAIEPDRLDVVELCARLRGVLGDPAVLDDATQLTQEPTRTRLYNAACSLGSYHRHRAEPRVARRAIEFLHRAIRLGIPPATVAAERDLASLHGEPDFPALLPSPVAR